MAYWELLKNWGFALVSLLSALDALRIRFWPTVVPIPAPIPAPQPIPVPQPIPTPEPPKPVIFVPTPPKPPEPIVPPIDPKDPRVVAFEALLQLKDDAKDLISDEAKRTAALAGIVWILFLTGTTL